MSEVPKKLTAAQIRKKADSEAMKLVHAFVKKYMDLDENDDTGHDNNESDFISQLLNIYDAEENQKNPI